MSTKLERLIWIDALIRAGRYPNARRTAKHFEVSERTVYDDQTFLKERLNAPIAYDSVCGGWYYTEPTWVLPATITTEGELLAFLLSTELAGSYLGSAYEDALRKAISNLAQSLPEQVHLDLGELAAHYSFIAGATAAVHPRLLSDLTTAIRERRPVEVRYYTASRAAHSERIFHPYALRNVRGDWQVVAYDSLREMVRIFALPRIEQWRVLHGQQFDLPEAFSLQDYMEGSFLNERGGTPETIVIQFDEYQARYIRERTQHPTQEPLRPLPNGGVELRFKSGALEEVKRWCLAFGPHARVIAPPALRAMIAADVAGLAQIYGADCISEDISQ